MIEIPVDQLFTTYFAGFNCRFWVHASQSYNVKDFLDGRLAGHRERDVMTVVDV